MSFKNFCLWTNLDEDEEITSIAYTDFIDQKLAICEWWAEYGGDYL